MNHPTNSVGFKTERFPAVTDVLYEPHVPGNVAGMRVELCRARAQMLPRYGTNVISMIAVAGRGDAGS